LVDPRSNKYSHFQFSSFIIKIRRNSKKSIGFCSGRHSMNNLYFVPAVGPRSDIISKLLSLLYIFSVRSFVESLSSFCSKITDCSVSLLIFFMVLIYTIGMDWNQNKITVFNFGFGFNFFIFWFWFLSSS